MPIQGLNFTILSGQEGHKSFQSTSSFIVYNPNDGIVFVGTDRTATQLTWDYKIPSQSGGKFPGPINSYLSMVYQDQSGSGGAGQIVVYASREAIDIPHFWSIGRAIQSQATSLDIVQGVQPGNPGSGITRVWVDNTGNLHLLNSSGVDKTVIDTGTALGGVLTGFLPNPGFATRPVFVSTGSASVQGAGTINLIDTTGDVNLVMTAGSGPTRTKVLRVENGSFQMVNSANTAILLTIDDTGNGAFTNTVSGVAGTFSGDLSTTQRLFVGTPIGGGLLSGDISTNRGNSTGAIFIGDASHYIFNTGSNLFQLAGGSLSILSGGLTLNGNLSFSVGTNLLLWPDGSNIYASGGMVISLPNVPIGFYNTTLGRYNFTFGGTGFGYPGVNGGGLTAQLGDTRFRIFNGVAMNTTVGSIYAVTPGVVKFLGIVMIVINSAQMIMAALQGGANAVGIIWSNCAATAGFGVGSTFNVGFSASDYYLENRSGNALAYYVVAFGIN